MKDLYAQVGHYDYAEQQIQVLKKEISGLNYYIFGLIFIIVVLFTAIFLQWKIILRLRQKNPKTEMPFKKPESSLPASKKEKASPKGKPQAAAPMLKITSKELPDPGLVFKFALNSEEEQEKSIVIGQKNGTIKTYSTEIIDDHLSIFIRIVENRERDIYNVPDKIEEEYQLQLRRDGKALIYYQGLSNFQEMPSRERIYIKKNKDESGDLTFAQIDPQQPIRMRLGDRLNQDGKFVNGFFEFHFFTQNQERKNKLGVTKIEKVFYLRLYKIYPGYDTAKQTAEGLFPMVDPFAS